MTSDETVVEHYRQPELLTSIERAVEQIGRTPETVTVEELAPADEFHIGGRPATLRLFDQLAFDPRAHLLDVGCGIGGPARFAAGRVERVTGVDLTPAFVETGNALNRWVGLDDRIELRVGNALALDFPDQHFDGGYMIHLGMNVEDKTALLAEVARVLRPGALFGIYDVMAAGRGGPGGTAAGRGGPGGTAAGRGGPGGTAAADGGPGGGLAFPVPWAADGTTSHVVAPERYLEAAAAAGLAVVALNDRSDESKQFFDRIATGGGPQPLGLHLIMGPTVGTKVANMIAGYRADLIAPVELIVRRGR